MLLLENWDFSFVWDEHHEKKSGKFDFLHKNLTRKHEIVSVKVLSLHS